MVPGQSSRGETALQPTHGKLTRQACTQSIRPPPGSRVNLDGSVRGRQRCCDRAAQRGHSPPALVNPADDVIDRCRCHELYMELGMPVRQWRVLWQGLHLMSTNRWATGSYLMTPGTEALLPLPVRRLQPSTLFGWSNTTRKLVAHVKKRSLIRRRGKPASGRWGQAQPLNRECRDDRFTSVVCLKIQDPMPRNVFQAQLLARLPARNGSAGSSVQVLDCPLLYLRRGASFHLGPPTPAK